MLRWIRVHNIAVIEKLEVDFDPGLNLLTGETGAGKSILIDALGLVLGSRASSDQVRDGADAAVVEAGFELDAIASDLANRLSEAGVEVDNELVIRREVTTGGRGKVSVNGVAAARQLLRDIGPFLADIHGQGENSSLLRPEAGLELLDGFGGTTVLAEQVKDALRGVRKRESELALVESRGKERESLRVSLEHELAELEKVAARPNEDDELAEERRIVGHAEKLKDLASEVYRELYDDDGAALTRLKKVWSRVESLAAIDSRWSDYLSERSSVMGQLEDLSLYARDYSEQIDVTPGRLDVIEARLATLERLKRKYGGSLAAVIERRDLVEHELTTLDSSEERITELKEEVERGRARFLQMARELSRMRANAAKDLEKRVSKELPSLALPKARFVLSVVADDAAWADSGIDTVEMLFSANPGEAPRPLAKTASGGELSRFMLALKSVAAKDEQPKALVFDEVDAGIGGRVADAVGEKLMELAARHQVICVTHLPQIASFAPAHFRIDKMERKGRTETTIARLDEEGRVDELARMLAGATVTESAREHARQLLSGNKAKTKVNAKVKAKARASTRV